MIPFIFFFPSFVKILSVLIYIVGLIGGLILYTIKNKGKIVDRIDVEEKERQVQQMKEELGKWKWIFNYAIIAKNFTAESNKTFALGIFSQSNT